ncbi:predicted protein [Nematostella vectensis]|uniref:phosphoenolpyruvate carboxykinase (GTP) n=1 Tax=Nematostella vectensis TaxID=45351 RepID=A7S416_NEMVE|nr:phosphoenolpyruvate carboxykinase, cytosolic [GTP] [Nematostella vectensis]XP_032238796.1 phosphoenolpyruvate carboxykinase, cytosolic [GTP] [Nematostella vectensis]EDO41587.1 predicted protein [Nematostella vectensis]|eukprot:XP_001633650.1 predicted protein [Nematostella vectensis]
MPLPPVAYGNWDALPKKVQEFVEENAKLMTPAQIHICDGSDAENKANIEVLLNKGAAVPLEKHENCYAVFTDPQDVARVESRTFICTKCKDDAVPHFKGKVGKLARWMSLEEAHKKLYEERYPGCMTGRTMYVLPFSMGPVGSPISKIGIQLTDSEYVVCCMRIMTRMGSHVLKALGDGDFVRGVHSVGFPLKEGVKEVPWPCDPERTLITHFPATREIKSYGSGYGGNSLLGKKCFALRIASNIAHDEGWLAEHMMIMGLTNPEGKKIYIAAAFPSACGKTNLAMLTPTIPGWKCECVGDDINWMWFDKDGTLRAINPESGFFGVCPGTTFTSNPIAMKTFQKDTIFTNVAVTSDGDFWWEGLAPPAEGIKIRSWKGDPDWKPTENGPTAAHPNSRFCAPSDHCPIMDKDWENPAGVPISAILFGGRRPYGVPLVMQSFNWQHGVFLATSLSSETTAAAEFKGKAVMRDPFAMRPFFGYNFGKYLEHWLNLSKDPKKKLPLIFHVNWFRLDKNEHFLWPGFGENSRVLEWVFRRVHGEEIADPSPVGLLPKYGSLNLDGLKDPVTPEAWNEMFSIPKDYWLEELTELRKYFTDEVGIDLPKAIEDELNALENRLKKME